MSWYGTTEHASLHAMAASLVAELDALESQLRYGGTQHIFHTDSAARCRSLGVYLQSVIADAERDAYAPSLGLLRSALEHVYIDELVFLGQRYVQIFRNVDEDTWAKWQQERDMGGAWIDVTDWSRTKRGEVRITRQGIHAKDARDEGQKTIGIHYFLLSEYSPFVGPPSIQDHFDDGLSTVEERRGEAERNRFLYETYLRWSSIKESLRSNGLADEENLRRLDVHHRFLSAFVHPNTNVSSLLYGRNVWDWPTYDHYTSELILLYVIALSVQELRNFRAMSQRQPSVEISAWDETERLCGEAWRLASHLWFPGHEPHAYDRFAEANRRRFRELRLRIMSQVANPTTLPADEISYYENPLERLVKLHASVNELATGLSYVSPWPRADALLR